MSEAEETEIERGPNGRPYVDTKRSKVSGLDNGEFTIRLQRTDGNAVIVNLTREQMEAFRDAVEYTLEWSEDA